MLTEIRRAAGLIMFVMVCIIYASTGAEAWEINFCMKGSVAIQPLSVNGWIMVTN